MDSSSTFRLKSCAILNLLYIWTSHSLALDRLLLLLLLFIKETVTEWCMDACICGKTSTFLGRTIHPTHCSEAQWLKEQRMFFQCQGKDEYYSCPKKSTVPSFHGQCVREHKCAFIFIAPGSRNCSPEDMCCGWEEGQKWAQGVQKVKRTGQGSRLKTGSQCCFSWDQNTQWWLCYNIALLFSSGQRRQKENCRGATTASGKVWSFPSAFFLGFWHKF